VSRVNDSDIVLLAGDENGTDVSTHERKDKLHTVQRDREREGEGRERGMERCE
jgi:hypothetical protein